jgi:hypothetical protein
MVELCSYKFLITSEKLWPILESAIEVCVTQSGCKNAIQKMKHLWQGWEIIFSEGPGWAISM